MYRLLPLPQFILSVNLRAFGFPPSRDLLFGSNLLTMSVTDDGYPRDASCARLIIWFRTRETRRVQVVQQERLSLPDKPKFNPSF